jgi:hypothetical protein
MEMQLYIYYWYNRRKRRNIFLLHTNTWPHTFMAWNEHFNKAWRVTLINRAQTAPVSEMMRSSKCFLRVWKIPSSHITERTRIQLIFTLIFCKFNFCAKNAKHGPIIVWWGIYYLIFKWKWVSYFDKLNGSCDTEYSLKMLYWNCLTWIGKLVHVLHSIWIWMN